MSDSPTFRALMRGGAILLAMSLASCQLIIGLDDYYLAPACPPNAALCTVCNDPSDCDPPEDCHTWSCVSHLCQPVDAKAGSPCAQGVCSDLSPSTCVACNVDGDCPGADGYCIDHECFSCSDGIQNGDEIDVDCGFVGGHCPRCVGVPCLAATECRSGFCADGYCCLSACTEVCAACFLEGAIGNCSAVPYHMADPNSGCQAGGMVCNGGGGCGLGEGGFCAGPSECASGNCVNNTCVPPNP